MAEYMEGVPDRHVDGRDNEVNIVYVGVNMSIGGLW
jgi:hypothetical protein